MRKFRYILAMAAIAAAAAPAMAQQTVEQATDSIKNVLLQARQGDPVAQNEVGGWYYRGRHVGQNYEEALQWWARAAQQGNADAIGNMGLCYQTGHGIAKDSLKATQLYLRSIEAGNPALLRQNEELAAQGNVFSCMLVASCYMEGKGVPKDINKALPYLATAANKGCIDAQRDLGVAYLNGKKPAEAVKWFRMGARGNDPSCCYWYGKMLLDGTGIDPNMKEGAEYLLKSANAGFPQAMYAVGECYMDGKGLAPNPEQGVKWFRLAAGKGVGAAMWRLGQCYREGTGVAVSYDQAALWYSASLDKGYAKPFRNLVTDTIPQSPFVAYLRGMKAYQNKSFDEALKEFKTVEKAKITDGKVMTAAILLNSSYAKSNVKKGIKMLEEASSDPQALYLLAGLYEAGKGVDRNMDKAINTMRLAAQMDYAPAECALGDMYYEGRGTDRDYRRAVEWYSKAYAQGQLTDDAARHFATCYRDGLGGLQKDADKAKEMEGSANPANVAPLLKLL